MAEYIEREALLSELQEEIDFETSMYTDEQSKYFNMGLKCAVRDVKSQPTADVVPKSEVEELKAIIADHKASEERMEELYSNTKAEVAREIFEEIEKYSEVAHWNGLLANPVLCIGMGTLAELRKKYTGESDVKRDTV